MLRTLSALLLPLLLAGAAGAAAPIPAPLALPTRAYILEDFQTGRVLAADHADDRMEPASLTKLMTAYVVFTALHDRRLALADQVPISEHAWRSEGSRSFVQVGTRVPAEILIKGMIVQSGNDATIALAERIAGSEQSFVGMMNAYAGRLGLAHTHFADADGLPDPDHYSTARDLATLASALIRDFPDFYPWFAIREFTWNRITQQNRNGLLLSDPSVDGLKTGHTDSAGYCLATSALRDGMRLVAVVLGSASIKDREHASAALLGYGYSFYQTVKLGTRGRVLAQPRVFLSAAGTVPAGVAQDLYVTVGRDQAAGLRVEPRPAPRLVAPLAAGAPVGEVVATAADGTATARVPLVTLAAVPEAGLLTRLSDRVAMWFR